MLARAKSLVLLVALLATACSVGVPPADPAAAPSLPSAAAPGGINEIDRQAALGLPGPAGADVNNYLLLKPQFIVSYNHSRGIPNWVAWHLERRDMGPAERSDWAPDTSLPKDWRIMPFDYKHSGYTRGHMCPSGDRTDSDENNRATFLMTNMIPQTYDNNAGPWNDLERYCRFLANQHKELYIASGGLPPYKPLLGGRLAAPDALWKVIVVLPEGDNDLARVDAHTRVIAVVMPNINGIKDRPWTDYVTTVDAVERATGLDLLSRVPVAVQTAIESRIDNP